MKIQGNSPIPGPDPGAPKAKLSPAGHTKPLADTAGVSDVARTALDSDVPRIEELKQQYEAGTYSIPAADLAASIVNTHKKI